MLFLTKKQNFLCWCCVKKLGLFDSDGETICTFRFFFLVLRKCKFYCARCSPSGFCSTVYRLSLFSGQRSKNVFSYIP